MKLIINKTYKFIFQVGRNNLTFTGTVISVDDNFVEFKDKFGKTLHYNLNSIISYEEAQ